jgi:uncharacterized protein
MSSRAGRISYVQIPATDAGTSAAFYETVFGWNIRHRDDGHVAFDDTTGQVSGEWVADRPPSTPGMLLYIRVDDVTESIDVIRRAGGRVVSDRTPQREGEAIATFADPAGNVVGIFQEPG